MKQKFVALLVAIGSSALVVLTACQSAGKNVASGSAASGGVQVTVSAGVELVTPGVPLPTQVFSEADEKAFDALLDLPDATDINLALSQAGVQTLDTSNLGLPAGLTLYPGASDPIAAENTGLGVSGVTQDTTDSPQQIIAYYEKTLNAMGYSETVKKGPDSAGKYSYAWLGNSQLITVTILPDNGRNKILLSWMKM